jgi:hypothetical protein
VLTTDLVQCIAVPRPDSAARKIGNGVNRPNYHMLPALDRGLINRKCYF